MGPYFSPAGCWSVRFVVRCLAVGVIESRLSLLVWHMVLAELWLGILCHFGWTMEVEPSKWWNLRSIHRYIILVPHFCVILHPRGFLNGLEFVHPTPCQKHFVIFCLQVKLRLQKMTSVTFSIGPCGAKWPETFHLACRCRCYHISSAISKFLMWKPSLDFHTRSRFWNQLMLPPILSKWKQWQANPSPSSEVGRSPSFLCRWPILRTRDLDQEILTHSWCPSWSEAFNPTTCVHWNVCAVNLVAFVQFKYVSRGCCPSVNHPFTPLF